MKFNPKKVIPLVLVAVLAVAAGSVWMRARGGKNPAELKLPGSIEVTRTEVSFKVPGKVEKRLVSEGEVIKAGAPVARLDPSDLDRDVALRQTEVRAVKAALSLVLAGARREDIAQAEDAEAGARARLAELKAGARAEEVEAARASVAQASSALEEARLGLDFAKSEHARIAKLFEKDFVSDRDREAAKTNLDSAQARYATAQGRREEAEAKLKLLLAGTREEVLVQAQKALDQTSERKRLLVNGSRPEDVEQARARLAQAEEGLALARTRRGYAEISSPIDGVVLSQAVEGGEYVNPGTPVVTVGDLANPWLRGYVDETDLGRVALGQAVEVTSDTWPGKVYRGKVAFISSEAEFTPRTVQTEKERVKLVYRVKVNVENPGFELKPGMPAVGLIRLGPG